MTRRALQMIVTAVGQNDPVLWLTERVRASGADFDVLLASTAVRYAVRRVRAEPLVIGTWRQKRPPSSLLPSLIAKRVTVYAVGDDLVTRGIERTALIEGVHVVPWYGVPALFERYDYIFRW